MHEMAFAQQILDCVQSYTADYPNARVTRLRLASGARLALDPASLRFCLEAIAVGSVMDGASIELLESPNDQDSALTVEEIELNEYDAAS